MEYWVGSERINSPMENSTTESISRKCRRILLAEDYKVNQKIAQLILQKAGYQVDVVINGQEAVEAYKKNHYDLILMDIHMPVMDGHEATKRIRSWEGGIQNKIGKNSKPNSEIRIPHSDLKRVPIIAMTGDASMNSFAPKRYPGMDDCVCKPLQRDHLLSVMDRWIDCGSSRALDKEPINEIGAPAKNPDETNLPLDLDRAIDEFMGKKKILYEVLDQFMLRAGDQITGLRRAGCRSDYGVVASEAHRLKGGAANLRAGRLARVASDLEKAAEGKKTEEICGLIEKLAEEFLHLEKFIKKGCN
jgi:CheY-like chemotaxis protein